MIRAALFLLILQVTCKNGVHSAQQQLKLSDSYLPVAMQVISHLTDQMSFEVDEATSTTKPTTSSPYVTSSPYIGSFQLIPNGWWMSYSTKISALHDQTTPYHKPGLYAPASPPKPTDRYNQYHQRFVLLPLEQQAQYTVIQPQETPDAPLLSIHEEEIKPIVEPRPESHLLPPHHEVKISSRSDGFVIDDDLSEDSLQYLSEDVKEMIKMARNPEEDRVVDVWEGVRSGPQSIATKANLSSSNLRLLLLYDLLSREAKRQKLSDFSGFSPDVMKVLVDSSSGGARAQLQMALSKMVERHDCAHEYANNRAKEMVVELGKDESKLSSELRYLQPLVYKY